jgi:hypothetical protein
MKTDYYVYGHYLKDGDILFYVGKGRRNRKVSTTGRSKEWLSLTKENEWYARILKEGLSEKEAYELESKMIASEKNLINKMQSTVTKEISKDVLDYFYYDETSPSGLRWNKPVVGRNGRIYQNIGDVAGILKETSDKKNKRWIVKFLGNSIYAHRIVYALHHFLPNSLVIDHTDGNSLNNNINNLRAVTQEINSRNNKRDFSKTSTGALGVSKCKKSHLNFSYYIATWYENGKLKSKEFSTFKMSDEEAFASACRWREDKIKELNEQGAGYTTRHTGIKE